MGYNIINVENISNHSNLVITNPCRYKDTYPPVSISPEVRKYLQATKKGSQFQRLRTIWQEIRDSKRKAYILLNHNKPWQVQVYAIYKQGIRIFHE